MRLVCLDLETFFSDEFTLKKLSTEAYIRDPRFKAHGAAIKWDANTLPRWYDEPELRYHLKNEDWSDVGLICWHAQFDGFILNHHYGIKPKMWFCPMSMSRLLIGNHVSVSLDSMRAHFGLRPKITPYNLFRGLQWNQMTPDVQRQVGEGAVDEVESIWNIFGRLSRDFPQEEYECVDMTVRMFTEPELRGDVDALAKVWESEAHEKARRMAALNVREAELQSSDCFAALLRAEGVEPGYKNGKNGEIFAFAKTDDFMQDLLESGDERVRTLAEARLGVKSTMLQTRAETMGFAAQRGPMPVYLRYCGAHTTRWSGGDGCLTADTQVLTLDISGVLAYKNIVDVLISDLVWDGEEFVEHEGVRFAGYREVVSWDGVNGTPDHQVRTGEAWQDLGEALRTEAPIMDCREPTAWEVEAGRARQRSRSKC